jgi:hypothetical protein
VVGDLLGSADRPQIPVPANQLTDGQVGARGHASQFGDDAGLPFGPSGKVAKRLMRVDLAEVVAEEDALLGQVRVDGLEAGDFLAQPPRSARRSPGRGGTPRPVPAPS